MKKHVLFGWLLVSLASIGTGEAQGVEPIYDHACPPRTDCDGVCTFNFTPYYEQAVRLHDLLVGAADHKTVRLEEFPNTNDPKLQQMRETWYVRKASLTGQTGPLYRCWNSAIPDHRESSSSSEGSPAYSCVSGPPNILTNPWIDSAKASRTPVGSTTSGLLPLRRYVKSGGTDYRTWIEATPNGYVLNTTFSSTNARLGYQRFGKLLHMDQVLGTGANSGYGLNFLDNGVLKVDFNSIWGNAIGRITQLATGRQIVSEPIGDMVQSVVRFENRDPDCRVPNPTQSGGAQCVAPDYSITTRWAGSPVVSTTRNGTNPQAPQTFTSVVRPLDFCHNGRNRLTTGATPSWPGTTDTDPLLWNGFIQRSETLSCKLGTTVRKDVLRTVSRYQLAQNHTGDITAVVAGNEYWLRPKDLVTGTQTTTEWDFRIYCKNLATGNARQMLVSANGKTRVNVSDNTCGNPPNDTTSPRAPHAIIASRTDGTFAYAVAQLKPGLSTGVTFRCAAGAGCGNPTKGAVIIQVGGPASLPLSKTQWSAPQESFLIVTSKGVIMDNAINRLNELYQEAIAGGVDCLN